MTDSNETPEDDHNSQRQQAWQRLQQAEQRQRQRWRLDVPVWNLALKTLLVIALGWLVGNGLAVLYQVLRPLF